MFVSAQNPSTVWCQMFEYREMRFAVDGFIGHEIGKDDKK